jgi:uncharacterized protein
MRRMLASVLAILVAASWFSGWTFARLERLSGPGWTAVPMLLAAGFVATTMLSRRTHARLLSAANVACAVSIGFTSNFTLAALASWTALAVLRLSGAATAEGTVASVLYGAAAAAGLAGLVSSYWLRVTRVAVQLPNLPRYWNGRTLALVTDVHLGNFRGPVFSRRIVSLLARLRPECVLVGGDMFDGSRMNVGRAVGPWAALSPPSGVYFIGGNHDEHGPRDLYFEALRGVGMRVLDNERVDLRGLQLVGVHDRETLHPGIFRQVLERARLDDGAPSILLAHRPSNLSVPEEAGIGLQLSGHTHHGQFWPWTIMARRAHGKFAYGLHRFGRMLVYTSSGAGTWGPPFRLGSRSEVVLIRLEAA